jgi:L-methionine (R)-S-oxide reductase
MTQEPVRRDTVAAGADDAVRQAAYDRVSAGIRALIETEPDWIAAMATVACELAATFDYFHWTGFYRAVTPQMLVVGPYQGGHGCLRIPFGKGVCGTAAATRATQFVPDVDAFPGHIACASTTRSEVVVPILTPAGEVLGVLDIDSDLPAAFSPADQAGLEAICAELGRRYASTPIR